MEMKHEFTPDSELRAPQVQPQLKFWTWEAFLLVAIFAAVWIGAGISIAEFGLG